LTLFACTLCQKARPLGYFYQIRLATPASGSRSNAIKSTRFFIVGTKSSMFNLARQADASAKSLYDKGL
jgi:hypothetical protein